MARRHDGKSCAPSWSEESLRPAPAKPSTSHARRFATSPAGATTSNSSLGIATPSTAAARWLREDAGARAVKISTPKSSSTRAFSVKLSYYVDDANAIKKTMAMRGSNTKTVFKIGYSKKRVSNTGRSETMSPSMAETFQQMQSTCGRRAPRANATGMPASWRRTGTPNSSSDEATVPRHSCPRFLFSLAFGRIASCHWKDLFGLPEYEPFGPMRTNGGAIWL